MKKTLIIVMTLVIVPLFSLAQDDIYFASSKNRKEATPQTSLLKPLNEVRDVEFVENEENVFADIKNQVNVWYSSIESVSTRSSKASKSIDFTTQHYSISGVIAKGVLCEGTTAKFYETASLVPSLLLEGRISYQTSRLVVEGIRYIKTLTGTSKIYGTFYVYNMVDFTMNYKPKKAGSLKIKCAKASYLEGFYLECPVIVRMNEKASVYVDGKTGGRGYSFLSAIIPNITLNDNDSFDIYQILLQAKDDVTICWENGIMFKGKVRPTPREDGSIVFYTLDGEKTGMTTGPKRIIVSRENGNLIYTQEHNNDNQPLSKETLYVRNDETLSETDYWNLERIYENCYLAKWEYRNGNYFEGSVKGIVTADRISASAIKGVFRYSNGDRFEGDVSTKTVGPFFIDGTTYFVDGTVSEGNWLENFRLSDSQWAKVYNCENPSKAKELAKELMIAYEKQMKQERYQSLLKSVQALGETPYQKALRSLRDKYFKKIEENSLVSRQMIRDCMMTAETLTGSIFNQATLGASIVAILALTVTNVNNMLMPSKVESVGLEIMKSMEIDLKQVVKLALPIELELEKLQMEMIASK